MKKVIILFGILISTIINAQVGIKTEDPTETLDINGNLRVRGLYDANGSAEYPHIVVANNEGVLGYKAPKPATNGQAIMYKIGHVASGLVWNTKDTPTNQGEQDEFKNYLIFGTKGDEVIDMEKAKKGWTYKNTSFSADEGDLLKVSTLISFKVYKNYLSTNEQLNTISAHGDRQVSIILYLYKGNTMLRKNKKIINFNGRDDGRTINGYDNFISQNLQFDYKVPPGGAGSDYEVSVLVEANAPRDGNFRIDFAHDVTQDIMVVEYK